MPSLDSRVLMHASIAIAGAQHAVMPLMAQTLTTALDRKQPIDADALARLRAALEAAGDPGELAAAMTSKEARMLRLPALVEERVKLRELAFIGGKLVELPRIGERTFTGDALTKLARAFSNADLDERAVQAALGLDAAPATLDEAMLHAFGSNLEDPASQLGRITELYAGGALNDAMEIKNEAMSLAKRSKELLTQYVTDQIGRPAIYVARASDLYSQLKALPELSKVGGTMDKVRAYAALAHTALSALGLEAQARDVQRALGYVETGYQVAQCIGVLAAGASGWGAAFAVAGLASGMGNLSMPILGGGHSDDDGSKAVLQALAALNVKLDREFAKVNEKLDRVLLNLGEISGVLNKIDATLEQVKEAVARVESNVDYIVVQNRLSFMSLVKIVHVTELDRNKGVLDEAPNQVPASDLAAALRFAGSTTLEFATNHITSERQELADPPPQTALAILRATLSSQADPQFLWSSMNALSKALQHQGIETVPVSNANWDVVASGVSFANEVAAQHPATLASLTEAQRKSGLASLAKALRRHGVFLDALHASDTANAPAQPADEQAGAAVVAGPDLRKGTLVQQHKVLGPLVRSYLAELRKLRPERASGQSDEEYRKTGALHAARTLAMDTILDQIDRAPDGVISLNILLRDGSTRIDFAPITPIEMSSPNSGSTFSLFGGSYASYWNRIGNLAKVPIMSTAEPVLKVELISVERATAATIPFWMKNDRAEYHMRIYVASALLDNAYGTSLLNFQGSYRPPAEKTLTDPIAYVSGADGKGGDVSQSDAYPIRVADTLQRLYGTVRSLQGNRISENPKLHLGMLAALMSTPDHPMRMIYEPTLKRMGQLGALIHAVVRMGYGDIYTAMDPLNALFEGGLISQLIDERCIDAWSRAVAKAAAMNSWPPEDPDRPGQFTPDVIAFYTQPDAAKSPLDCLMGLEDVALARYERLVHTLDVMLEAARGQRGMQYELLERSFSKLFPTYWADAQ